ncbi:caspase family protein [bacterium]|nr:caspase family protein [bacterium]
MGQLLNFKWFQAVCTLYIVVLLFPFILNAATDEKGTGEFYIREYGILSSNQNPTVEQAQLVFRRLLKSANAKQNNQYRLIILPKSAANWLNWAMCLPDGSVILVENILDLCFENHTKITEKGRARLAFILAHEISHLLDNHHTHLNRGTILHFQEGSQSNIEANIRKIESQADYSGLILMTLADYEPRFLIDQSNFFQEYLTKVRSNNNFDDHFPPQKRKDNLKENLEPLIDELPLFASGVRYLKKQEYGPAIESFTQFAEMFPGREVYNNIGLSYYQMALKDQSKINPKTLFRFMLSTVVDSNTLAIKLAPDDLGAPRSLKQQFKKNLEKSKESLKVAIHKDPDYAPAKINLSSVYITEQRFEEASKLVDEVLRQQPANSDAINNKAVALYLSNPEKNAAKALTLLNNVEEMPMGYSFRYSNYNKSRIRFEQLDCLLNSNQTLDMECLSIARKSWNPFLSIEDNTHYARLVKSELGGNKQKQTRLPEKNRVALVFGNSSYKKAPLLNPLNDASAMKDTLEDLGFKVVLGLDLTRQEMLREIKLFEKLLTTDSTGLIYYSGHGLQVKGENFLLPIGVESETISFDLRPERLEETIREVAISLNTVLEILARVDNVQNIIILDACRDNPLPGISSEFQGFDEMNAPPRTYIAYSTSPGKVAWDGLDGNYGVFTRSLLNHIKRPNVDVKDLFQIVRKEVAGKTGDYQITWDVSTLDEQYYFNPPKPQDWTWHITAGVLMTVAAWQSREEAKKYRELNEENDYLKKQYDDSLNLEEYIDIRERYYINQEKMKTHKKNYEQLDIITMAALAWEAYLLIFETYDEGVYDSAKSISSPNVVLMPTPQFNALGLTLQWQW